MDHDRPANRLINETSPYLLQHAHNPVDWHPWCAEALEKSRQLDRPIFLSIGYSACHWCHVMEHESFEDAATAALMNEHFVNIKVDREERPDLDQIYMSAVQLLTQHGGWPMSVWLTPSLEPFHGGTYFPPERRHGMPSFREILRAVADAWKNQRAEIAASASRLSAAINRMATLEAAEPTQPPDASLIDKAARSLERGFDRTWGGIGRAPKFPHSVELRLMLRAAKRTGNEDFRDLVALTLDRMIRGGIYDQLGGGFHRYATDERWLVPHFEKMLYDNALIPLACFEAYQATGNRQFAAAAADTLDYVLREMTDSEGGFYSSQDADSEGEEGRYFVWSHRDVLDILGERVAEPFAYCYDVTREGNWEGKNILNQPKTFDQSARILGISPEALSQLLTDGRKRLFDARQRRVAPGRDSKILTAWNALMIDAFATGACVLGEARYAEAASRAADFLLGSLRTADGRLLRTWKDGQAKLGAYLEDYAYLANALVSVYEATFDARWIAECAAITERMLNQFWDGTSGGFFFTSADHEPLIARTKESGDGAIPAGAAVAATALVRLAKLTARSDLAAKAEDTFMAYKAILERSPMQASQMLIALGLLRGPTYEFAIIGDPAQPDTSLALQALHRRFLPNKVIALRRPKDPENCARVVPLLADKSGRGQSVTTYVCQDFSCQAPCVGVESLETRLDQLAAERA